LGFTSYETFSTSHIILVLRANHRCTIFSHPPSPLFHHHVSPYCQATTLPQRPNSQFSTQGDSVKIIKMSDSLATLQENQGQLIVVINRLQSEQLGDISTQMGSPSMGNASPAGNVVAHVARHGHKAAFPYLRWFGGSPPMAQPV
jgi:hypothetical protein